jgi:hypothetical protein
VDAGALMTTVLTQAELSALNPLKRAARPFKLAAPIPTEGDECASLLQWASVTRHKGQRLSDVLILIPNGAVLAGDARERAIQMARMKKLGFKAGVSDYLLAVPSGNLHGLWIEMKRTVFAVTSPEQIAFQKRMSALGYACVTPKGWEKARAAIREYLCSTSAP